MAEESGKSLRVRVKEALHRYSAFGKLSEVADRRRHAFNERVRVAKHLVASSEGALKKLRENGATRRSIDDEEQAVALNRHTLKRMRAKRDFWRNRYTWAWQRHQHWGLVLKHRRDRLRRFIAQHHSFEPYMANGHPWSAFTKEALYAIYLDFRHGLYVTATYEGYPGDGVHSTTSGHYLQNQPDGRARCWDAGSARRGPMVAAQRREAERCPSFLVELIGPENDCEFKNGVRYTLPEGDPLETMHDNHKHEWVRDGAPT